MRHFIIIIPLLLIQLATAQNEQTVAQYMQQAADYRFSQPDSSLWYYQKAIQLADQQEYHDWRVLARMQAAQLFLRKAAYEEGMNYARAAEKITKRHDIPTVLPDTLTGEKVNLYAYFGASFREGTMTQPDSAFYYFRLAEEANSQYNNPVGNWSIYRQLGTLYQDLGNPEKAEEYYLKAYETLEEYAPSRTPFMLYILTEFYFNQNNLEQYSHFGEQFIAYMDARNPDATIDNYHAAFFTITPENEAAILRKLTESIAFHEKRNNWTILARTWLVLGDFYLDNQNYPAAQDAFEAGLAVAESNKFTYLVRQFEQQLYATQKARGNFQAALQHHENFQRLNDSLRSEEAEARLAELEVQYETDKKEQQIQLQQLDITQKTQQRNFLFGGSLLLFLLGGTIVLGLRNRMKTNRKLAAQENALQEQRIQQLEQEKKLLSYTAMLEGQEAERKRIAQDLHDSLGGLLTTVKTQVGRLSGHARSDSAPDLYAQASELIDEACTEVRRISHDMMPRALEISGLKGALEDLTIMVKNQGMDCHLELINLPDNLQETQELMLYRSIQELVHNSQKHAEAKSLLIQLIGHEDALHVLVEDDGKGFDLESAFAKNGLGLKGVQSRIDYLQGTIDFDAVPGEGTTVTIEIPL